MKKLAKDLVPGDSIRVWFKKQPIIERVISVEGDPDEETIVIYLEHSTRVYFRDTTITMSEG